MAISQNDIAKLVKAILAILAGDIVALDEVGLPASTNCAGPSAKTARSFDLSYDKRDQLHRAITAALFSMPGVLITQ